MSEMKIREAIRVLTKALNDDPDYRRSWVANIAMSIADESSVTDGPLPHEWHRIFNRGAERFLNLLCMDHHYHE